MSLAAASLWFTSPALLAAGYLAHGVWDIAHHPRGITTMVTGWYPPFCLVYDILVRAFVVVWLTGLTGAVAEGMTAVGQRLVP